MSKYLKGLIKEYKEAYKEWNTFMEEHYGDVEEIPDDELLLCIAVSEALESLRKLNDSNRKKEEN